MIADIVGSVDVLWCRIVEELDKRDEFISLQDFEHIKLYDALSQDSGLDVLLYLLHQATHVIAAYRCVKETSGGGRKSADGRFNKNRYHNENFAKIAEELGCITTMESGSRAGWQIIDVLVDVIPPYKAILDRLDEQLPNARRYLSVLK